MCKWLGLRGLREFLNVELNWAILAGLAFRWGGRGELNMDEQDVQDQASLLCILSILCIHVPTLGFSVWDFWP